MVGLRGGYLNGGVPGVDCVILRRIQVPRHRFERLALLGHLHVRLVRLPERAGRLLTAELAFQIIIDRWGKQIRRVCPTLVVLDAGSAQPHSNLVLSVREALEVLLLKRLALLRRLHVLAVCSAQYAAAPVGRRVVLRHDLRSVGGVADCLQGRDVAVSLQLSDHRRPARVESPQILAALDLLHVLDQVAGALALQGL